MSHSHREIQLDVLRGVAIFLAMGWHLNSGSMGSVVSDVWLFPGRSIGWAGVDLFFVLSGFLVGGLVIREVMDSKRFDYTRFLIRRAFRLWPVLYIYLVAQVFLTDRHWLTFVPQVLAHVQNFFETPLNHLWSLAVEEQFYLAVGLAIPALLACRFRSTGILTILVTIIVGSMVLRPIAYLLGVASHPIQIQTQFRLDGLAMGVLLALLYQRFPQVYLQLRRRRILNGAIAVASFSSLVWVGGEQVRPMVGYSIATVGSAFAILSIHQAAHGFWTSSAARAVAWLGLYSYPLYIWHNGLGNQVAPKLAQLLGLGSSPDIVVLMKYAVSILGAFAMAKAVEQPFMVLRDNLFPRMTRPPSIPVVA